MNSDNHPLRPFIIPGKFGDDVPFSDMHVWQWADSVPERKDVTTRNYLLAQGFVIGVDCVTEAQHQTLDYAIEHWHRYTARFARGTTCKLSDCLIPDDGEKSFYLWGSKTRYRMTVAFKAALINAGWIYDPAPDNTYFKLENGVLWACYQQIIGSRLMARISE